MGYIVTKSESVLRITGRRDAATHFSTSAEDGRRTTLKMETDVWEDMGRPEVVTVTIEPGDRLND